MSDFTIFPGRDSTRGPRSFRHKSIVVTLSEAIAWAITSTAAWAYNWLRSEKKQRRRRRTVDHLLAMDDDRLKDIGIRRDDLFQSRMPLIAPNAADIIRRTSDRSRDPSQLSTARRRARH